jgi:hypothetical protein
MGFLQSDTQPSLPVLVLRHSENMVDGMHMSEWMTYARCCSMSPRPIITVKRFCGSNARTERWYRKFRRRISNIVLGGACFAPARVETISFCDSPLNKLTPEMAVYASWV